MLQTVAEQFLHSVAPFFSQKRAVSDKTVCRAPLGAQREGFSMVKMSLDPVQVMSGQVKELKVSPSSNGESRGSWDAKEEFDQDHLGLTTKPKSVSPTDHSCASILLFPDHQSAAASY